MTMKLAWLCLVAVAILATCSTADPQHQQHQPQQQHRRSSFSSDFDVPREVGYRRRSYGAALKNGAPLKNGGGGVHEQKIHKKQRVSTKKANRIRPPKQTALEEDKRVEREVEQRQQQQDLDESEPLMDAQFGTSFDDLQRQTMNDAEAQARHYGAPKYTDDSAGDQRMAFQIHGHEGPQSYRYGFDTGKGYNRQFRYEEKDGQGIVHGRYGYYDKEGKLKIVNYTAHPKHGFAVEGEFGKYP